MFAMLLDVLPDVLPLERVDVLGVALVSSVPVTSTCWFTYDESS